MAIYDPTDDNSLEQELTDREAMIEFLSNSDYDYIMQTDGGVELLRSYIEDGFKGYSNFTDAELKLEVEQRKEMESQ
jgi:hypothetical protein